MHYNGLTDSTELWKEICCTGNLFNDAIIVWIECTFSGYAIKMSLALWLDGFNHGKNQSFPLNR